MSHVSAIVLAAGKGERFKSKTPKLLARINHKPVIVYSLEAFSRHPSVREIIVVVNAGNSKDIIKKIRQYRIPKITKIVEGGLRRQDSVKNGLKDLDERTSLVLIHDAARPFIDKEVISSVINKAERTHAAIAGVPVKATIKEASGIGLQVKVKKTLDREKLWEIQTPQVFSKDLILKAYKKFSRQDVTDDAMLVEKLGVKVSVIKGSYNNIKITTPEDLIIAEAILRAQSSQCKT